MSLFQKITEGIVSRDLSKEQHAIYKKWEKFGLLEGLKNEHTKQSMALLLENQAKELLREASAMQTGDVQGFASVAFPIVRRVFGNLIANDLVSVQPMSLPSGLIFFLDFTYTDNKYNSGAVSDASIYGGGVVGSQITGGINLNSRDSTNSLWNSEKGFYNLNNAYTSPTGSISTALNLVAVRSGSGGWALGTTGTQAYVNKREALILGDPELTGSVVGVYTVAKSAFTKLNLNNLVAIHTTAQISSSVAGANAMTMVRR